MANYILHFKGKDDLPAEDLAAIRKNDAVKIMDATGKTLLIQADDDETVRKSVINPAEWTITPEKFIPVPDTKKRVKE